MDKKDLNQTTQPVNQETQDPVEQLFGGAPKEVRDLARQLKNRGKEIEQWLNDDPKRFDLLTKDPQTTLADLQKALNISASFAPQIPTILNWEFVRSADPIRIPGVQLLRALWDFVSQTAANADQFRSDPFGVIDTVSATLNTTRANKEAVVVAFEQLHGKRPLTIDLLASLSGLHFETLSTPLTGIEARKRS